MRFSMTTTARRLWRQLIDKPLRTMGICALALAACSTSIARADATLTYELTDADGSKTVKKFSTARFYVRIEDPTTPDQYLLFEAGKFFPLYAVDTTAKTYTLLTKEVIPYMSPESREHHGADKTDEIEAKKPAPRFKATRKTRKVAGVECRVVHELVDGEPVIEHCMVNSARLSITKRGIITLARTFEMARNRDYGWLGAGTEDEEFVSVYSRDQRDNRTLQLTAVSNRPLNADYLRIPREYKQVKTEQEAAPEQLESEAEAEAAPEKDTAPE